MLKWLNAVKPKQSRASEAFLIMETTSHRKQQNMPQPDLGDGKESAVEATNAEIAHAGSFGSKQVPTRALGHRTTGTSKMITSEADDLAFPRKADSTAAKVKLSIAISSKSQGPEAAAPPNTARTQSGMRSKAAPAAKPPRFYSKESLRSEPNAVPSKTITTSEEIDAKGCRGASGRAVPKTNVGKPNIESRSDQAKKKSADYGPCREKKGKKEKDNDRDTKKKKDHDEAGREEVKVKVEGNSKDRDRGQKRVHATAFVAANCPLKKERKTMNKKDGKSVAAVSRVIASRCVESSNVTQIATKTDFDFSGRELQPEGIAASSNASSNIKEEYSQCCGTSPWTVGASVPSSFAESKAAGSPKLLMKPPTLANLPSTARADSGKCSEATLVAKPPRFHSKESLRIELKDGPLDKNKSSEEIVAKDSRGDNRRAGKKVIIGKPSRETCNYRVEESADRALLKENKGTKEKDNTRDKRNHEDQKEHDDEKVEAVGKERTKYLARDRHRGNKRAHTTAFTTVDSMPATGKDSSIGKDSKRIAEASHVRARKSFDSSIDGISTTMNDLDSIERRLERERGRATTLRSGFGSLCAEQVSPAVERSFTDMVNLGLTSRERDCVTQQSAVACDKIAIAESLQGDATTTAVRTRSKAVGTRGKVPGKTLTVAEKNNEKSKNIDVDSVARTFQAIESGLVDSKSIPQISAMTSLNRIGTQLEQEHFPPVERSFTDLVNLGLKSRERESGSWQSPVKQSFFTLVQLGQRRSYEGQKTKRARAALAAERYPCN